MFMEFDESFKYLYIVNRKPVDNTKYVLEDYPKEIERMR